jgi:hypothetical protein
MDFNFTKSMVLDEHSKNDHWKDATLLEINDIDQHGTFILIIITPQQKTVDTRQLGCTLYTMSNMMDT